MTTAAAGTAAAGEAGACVDAGAASAARDDPGDAATAIASAPAAAAALADFPDNPNISLSDGATPTSPAQGPPSGPRESGRRVSALTG